MGRNGAKYRVSSNGLSSATPRPPFVKASRMPCEAVAKKRKKNARAREKAGLGFGKRPNVSTPAAAAAKGTECQRPR